MSNNENNSSDAVKNKLRPEVELKDLSKSKLKDFLTCPTLFYLSEYHRDLKEDFDATTQLTFDNGRLVETYARTQFCLSVPLFKNILDKNPKALKSPLFKILSTQEHDLKSIQSILGEELSSQYSSEVFEAMKLVTEITDKSNKDKRESTRKALVEGKRIIFEASFNGNKNEDKSDDNFFTHVQADILYVNDDGSLDAHEIKSGGGKRMEEYEFDTATQLLVMRRNSQLKINKIYLWHINSQSVDDNIFTTLDMTELIEKNESKVLETEKNARLVQQQLESPKPVYKTDCLSCPFFKTSCGKNLIDNPKAVVNLPNFRQKWDLMNSGTMEVNIDFLKEVPTDLVKTKDKDAFLKANPHINYGLKNKNLIKSLINNQRYVNIKGIKDDLSKWVFPLRFFDFEAYMDVFRMFENTRPYEAIVTQFSCHQMNSPNDLMENLIHVDWLHLSCANPKKDAVLEIIKALGDDNGSIVSYNQTYEKTRIKELMKYYPEYTEKLEKILLRFVDLMEVIESNVYDPQFFGSYSLKVVSPVLLTIENGCYNDVDLKSGAAYTPTYKKMMLSNDTNEKDYLIKDMKKYCYYDTLNLYLIYVWLLSQIKEVDNEKK